MVWAWHLFFVTSRLARKLQTTDPGPQFASFLNRIKILSLVELLGFLVILGLMIAMRFGYQPGYVVIADAESGRLLAGPPSGELWESEDVAHVWRRLPVRVPPIQGSMITLDVRVP